MKKLIFFVITTYALISCKVEETDHPYFLIASEPAQTSVILSARINASDTLVDYDIKGKPAEVFFEMATDTAGKIVHFGPLITQEQDDFIARHEFTDLLPGTKYFYRIRYIVPGNERSHSPWQSFSTLAGHSSKHEFSFVMVTGMNFYRFHSGLDQYGNQAVNGGDVRTGFPGYLGILSKQPDFLIGNGDNVYYDQPKDSAAKTPGEMQKHWHRLFHMDNFARMAARVPFYWMKDDHDHRYNDSDTLRINLQGKVLLPTHEDGIRIFHQQAAFSAENYKIAIPYRSYRLNKDVQIWMVEGRDYRSPNHIPDGPAKSIWGKEQMDWLKQTLLESDAVFRLLISPTPMVGPDDAYKTDNHTNQDGFRYERDQFVKWLREKSILENGFYVLCGDRHWQYHSLAPDGLEEFSCGALVDANSRLGRLPGDPESTDPEGKITQFYTQSEPSGGFLEVKCLYEGETPRLRFGFYDENGAELYAVERR